jgi:hypothetical protein
MAGPWSCYARELGGCSDQPSREHYLSRSVLKLIGDTPIVEGLPGVPSGQRIGIGSLASKIMCDKHNSALSALDAAAARLFGAVQRFDADLRDTTNPATDSERLSGTKIERWLLKVGFGLAAANERTGRAQPIRDRGRMLRVLFGSGSWPRSWGMYVAAGLGDGMAAPADVGVETGVHPETHELMCVKVWIRFLPLLLALGQPNLSRDNFRPASIILDRPPEPATKTLHLSWGDGRNHGLFRFSRTGEIDGWAKLP